MTERKELSGDFDSAELYERYGWTVASESCEEKEETISGETSYTGTISSSGDVELTKHVTPDHTYVSRTYHFILQRFYKNDNQKRWQHVYEGIHSFFFFHPWVLFILAGIVLITFSIINGQVDSKWLFINPETNRGTIQELMFVGLMISVGIAAYGGYAWLLLGFFNLPTLLLTILTYPLRFFALKGLFDKGERKQRKKKSAKEILHALSIPLMILFVLGWNVFITLVLQQFIYDFIILSIITIAGIIFFIVIFWTLFKKTK